MISEQKRPGYWSMIGLTGTVSPNGTTRSVGAITTASSSPVPAIWRTPVTALERSRGADGCLFGSLDLLEAIAKIPFFQTESRLRHCEGEPQSSSLN